MRHESFSKDKYIDKNKHISIERKTVGEGCSVMHFHDFFEIELVLGGRGHQVLCGEEYPLGRGCLYLLTPADFHRVTAEPTLELINIMFDGELVSKELLGELFGDGSGVFLTLDEGQIKLFETIADLLIGESVRDDAYTLSARRALLEHLLITVMRYAGTGREEPADRRTKSSVMTDAMRYLYAHFREDPPLSRTAAACGYSTNYFSALWRENVGRGYSEFINSLKVTHTKMLLSSTEYQASEIAHLCGFSSLSNFYRVFRAEAGISPLEYRRMHKR